MIFDLLSPPGVFLDLLHYSNVMSPKAPPSPSSDLSDMSNLSDWSKTPLPTYRSYSSDPSDLITRFDFDNSELKAPSTPS